MSRFIHPMRHQLAKQWRSGLAQIQAINAHVRIVPEEGYEIFKPSASDPMGGSTRFNVEPTALEVTEKASATYRHLCIAVQGYLYLNDLQFEHSRKLFVDRFGTQVAYFRRNSAGNFDHVLGVHFDYSPNHTAHPAFHAQLSNFEGMFDTLQMRLNESGTLTGNHCRSLLATARIPTSQVDVFSFLLQVAADHLMSEKSGVKEQHAFQALTKIGSAIRGAGYHITRFRDRNVENCMESWHWYP